jgi:hypothetical protein
MKGCCLDIERASAFTRRRLLRISWTYTSSFLVIEPTFAKDPAVAAL